MRVCWELESALVCTKCLSPSLQEGGLDPCEDHEAPSFQAPKLSTEVSWKDSRIEEVLRRTEALGEESGPFAGGGSSSKQGAARKKGRGGAAGGPLCRPGHRRGEPWHGTGLLPAPRDRLGRHRPGKSNWPSSVSLRPCPCHLHRAHSTACVQ